MRVDKERANDQKLAAAAAEARSELDAERIAEKMQHEAKIEELERAAAICSAELAKLAKALKSKITWTAEALKAKVLKREREEQEQALEAQRATQEEAVGKQREEQEEALGKQREKLQQQRVAMEKKYHVLKPIDAEKEREEKAQQRAQPPEEDRRLPSPSLSQPAGSARRESAHGNAAEARIIPYGGGSRQRTGRSQDRRRSRSKSRSTSRRRQIKKQVQG